MAMLHIQEVDFGKIKVDVELKLGLSGALDDVTGKMRTVADALAGRLVPAPGMPGSIVCDHTKELEEIARLRDDLAASVSEVERLRKEVANAEVLKRVDTALIEGLQEARGGAIRASTEWRDQTIELGAKIARLETDKAEILGALSMMAARESDFNPEIRCDTCGSPPVCIGVLDGSPGFHCAKCCHHSGVDGWCVRLPDLENESEVSPAPALAAGSPPRLPPEDGAGEVVSPALSGQEAGHGAEAEHRADRALPESREPGRAVQERAEGGGDHGAGADVRSPGVRAGRDEAAGEPVRAEPDRAVLHAGGPVQRVAAAGSLELAPEGLTEDDHLYAQAISFVRSLACVSISLLQRQLFGTYKQARLVMDRLESEGIVGPPNGAGLREVLGSAPSTIPDDFYARRIFRVEGQIDPALIGEVCFPGTLASARAAAENWRLSEPALLTARVFYLYAEDPNRKEPPTRRHRKWLVTTRATCPSPAPTRKPPRRELQHPK